VQIVHGGLARGDEDLLSRPEAQHLSGIFSALFCVRRFLFTDLPKDLRALSYQAKMHDLELPILMSMLVSNEMKISRGPRLIMEKAHK
jgi:hypothetical protein